MDEEAAIMLILAFWAVLAYAMYQRFWVVRRLRAKLDKIADAALAAQPLATPRLSLPTTEEESELRKVKERLRVLERIAVEKEDTLSREIEELRAVGR